MLIIFSYHDVKEQVKGVAKASSEEYPLYYLPPIYIISNSQVTVEFELIEK